MNIEDMNKDQLSRLIIFGLLGIVCWIVLIVTIGFWPTFALFGMGVVKANTQDLN